MPSLDGILIFGAAVVMTTSNDDRSTQINEFFGLNGLESLDGGFRGRATQVSGILFGSTPADCASAVETFRAFDDGLYHTLVDTAGTTWLAARLRSFQPADRAFAHGQLGFARRYTATFHHLL